MTVNNLYVRDPRVYTKTMNTLDVMEGVNKARRGVRNLVGGGVTILMMLFFFPVLKLLVGGFVFSFRRSTKSLNINKDNYAAYMKTYLSLKEKNQEITSTPDDVLSRIPFIYRWFFKDLLKLRAILEDHIQELGQALKVTDPVQEDSPFREVGAKELWDRRAKAYEYKY